MLIHLEHITTADGLTHEAHLYPGVTDGPYYGAGIGIVAVHGSSGHCALRWVPKYGAYFSRLGFPVLCANNRGHHIAWATTANDGTTQYYGNAFERIDGCIPDIDAAVEWHLARGVKRVVIIGHSLGGLKVIYYQGRRQHPHVAGVASTSPVRLSYSRFLQGEDAGLFRGYIDRALALVQQGQPDELLAVTHPITTLFSAGAYVDKHGPEEKANVINDVPAIRCPLLLMGGSLELHSRLRDFPRELYAAATQAAARELHIIEGAGHDYAEQLPVAMRHVTRWIAGTILNMRPPEGV